VEGLELERLTRRLTIPARSASTSAYRAYYSGSWAAEMGLGLNATRNPVELACIICASTTLRVLVATQVIRTRMGAITAMKASTYDAQ
jgi:hypothetical protein